MKDTRCVLAHSVNDGKIVPQFVYQLRSAETQVE
jgi:hypothetical protein